MRFGSRGPCEFFFSDTPPKFAFTEIAWEDAEQGPGMVMSTLASEKNRLFLGQLHDQVFLLQLPESLSLLFSCAN